MDRWMTGWGDRCFDDVWKLESPVNNAIKLEKNMILDFLK